MTLVFILLAGVPADAYSAPKYKSRKVASSQFKAKKAKVKARASARARKSNLKKRSTKPGSSAIATRTVRVKKRDLIDETIVKTGSQRKNGSIFWTQGGMKEAETMATRLNAKKPATKHSSLEMIANRPPLSLPNGMATPQQSKMWKKASNGFGQSASGKARLVMGPGQWRDGNVFNTVEKPILTRRPSQGGRISQINVFEPDPKTGSMVKTHRWYNDGSPWDGPGSAPAGGEWKRNLAPKKR
jgi:hypothetical protein